MPKAPTPELPILSFPSAPAFARWLAGAHASSDGVWLRIAKKGSRESTVSYAEAVEVALIWGWIDGQKRPLDDQAWLQRFTRRGSKSAWSRINREKVEALEQANRMQPPGLAAVALAKADGRWAAAYPSAKQAEVPAELAAALRRTPGASEAFTGLDATNRYAVLYRVHRATSPALRAKKIAELVAMLARGETLHPPRARRAPPKRDPA